MKASAEPVFNYQRQAILKASARDIWDGRNRRRSQ